MCQLWQTMLTALEVKIKKGIIHFFKKPPTRNREKCKQLNYNRRNAIIKASFEVYNEGYNEAEGRLHIKGDHLVLGFM